MKLKNKQTGQIVEFFNNTDGILPDSLAKLCKEWEDYEEPKEFWYIDPEIGLTLDSTDPALWDKKYAIESMKAYGNYFETKEEAEKAVEKLKAWKRLKDRGIKFDGWNGDTGKIRFDILWLDYWAGNKNVIEDLGLLFGDEE